MVRLAKDKDWSKVDELLMEEKSLEIWRPFLKYISRTEEFPRYASLYRTAGYPVDDYFYFTTLSWAVHVAGKDSHDIEGLYNQIKAPDEEVNNVFVEGLLRCKKVREARKVVLQMLEANQTIDPIVGNLLIERLIESKDIPSARKAFLAFEKQRPNSYDISGLFRIMRFSSDFEWYLDNVDKCDGKSLRSALLSPWARNRNVFDPALILKAFRKWNIPPERYMFREILDRTAGHFDVLKLYSLGWNDAERDLLIQLLIVQKRFGIFRRDPVEAGERLVEISLQNPECLDISSQIVIFCFSKYRRFNFELCSRLVERLLFHGKTEQASQIVIAMIKDGSATASTGTCNYLLQKLHQYNQRDLAAHVIKELESIGSPFFESSTRFGRDLFKLAQISKQPNNPNEFPSIELFIFNLKSLVRSGKLNKARSLLQKYKPVHHDERRILSISKAEIFCRVPGKEEMLSALTEIKTVYEGTIVARVANYGLSVLSSEDVIEPERISYQSGDHRLECIRVANTIFQSVCLFHSFGRAMRVKRELYNGLPADMTTAKIYIHLHVQNPQENRNKSISDLLSEVTKDMRLLPDMDIYSLLLELAVARGTGSTIDDINFVLERLFSFGGVPDGRIFGHLFRWIQKNGDLTLAQTMLQLMEKNKVPPTSTVFDTMVLKFLEIGQIDEARKWLYDSAVSPNGLTKCSPQLVYCYYEYYYRNRPVLESQQELDKLLANGFDVPPNHLKSALRASLDAGQSMKARKYLSRLRSLKEPVDKQVYEELINLCFSVGDLNAAHQVHESWRTSIRTAEDDGFQPVPFLEMLQSKLSSLLTSNPDWFSKLIPHSNAQPAGLVMPILHLAIKYGKRISQDWCHQSLSNMIARCEDPQAISILTTYMATQSIPWPGDLCEQVCKQWSMLIGQKQ